MALTLSVAPMTCVIQTYLLQFLCMVLLRGVLDLIPRLRASKSCLRLLSKGNPSPLSLDMAVVGRQHLNRIAICGVIEKDLFSIILRYLHELLTAEMSKRGLILL
jgi:hypothetical protein